MSRGKDPLEKVIEKKVCDYATGLGFVQYKFTSPQRRSVPDRLFISPRGVVFFVEFKRLGEKPTLAQATEHIKIKAKGVDVYVIDNVEDGKNLIDVVLNLK